jgi:hypothetical protein
LPTRSNLKDRVVVPPSPAHDYACLRYRIDVVASNVADVVRSAGGWLFDRAMIGWDVNAVLPAGGNTRPLQILGVGTLELNSQFASAREGLAGYGLVVSAEMFASDARVRAEVLKALDRGLTEVALWGEGWPVEVDRQVSAVQHRLSAGARAFKVQALVAAEIQHSSVDFTETFLCDVNSCSPRRTMPEPLASTPRRGLPGSRCQQLGQRDTEVVQVGLQ